MAQTMFNGRTLDGEYHPFATKFTRTGERNMKNRKPYRTSDMKRRLFKNVEKIDGRFVSNAEALYHK